MTPVRVANDDVSRFMEVFGFSEELAMDDVKIGDTFRLCVGARYRVWAVVGFLNAGPLRENVVALKTLDIEPSEEGRLLVPWDIFAAAKPEKC